MVCGMVPFACPGHSVHYEMVGGRIEFILVSSLYAVKYGRVLVSSTTVLCSSL